MSRPHHPSRRLVVPLAGLFLALAGAPLFAQAPAGRPGPLPPMSGGQRSEAGRIQHDEMMEREVLAKLEAHWVEDNLCVVMSLAQVPRGLRVGNFSIVRYVDVDEEKQNRKLALDFPKKAQETNDHMGVWKACTETDPRLANAKTDELRITVRQFDQSAIRRAMEVFELEFPTEGQVSVISLRRDANGNLFLGG